LSWSFTPLDAVEGSIEPLPVVPVEPLPVVPVEPLPVVPVELLPVDSSILGVLVSPASV
jgi:hypothetical protein